MNGLILSTGAVLAFFGLFWRSWDRRATAPMWLIVGAIACAVVGGLLA